MKANLAPKKEQKRQLYPMGKYILRIVGGYENFDNEYQGKSNPQYVYLLKPEAIFLEGKPKEVIKDDEGKVVDFEYSFERDGKEVKAKRYIFCNMGLTKNDEGELEFTQSAKSWYPKIMMALTGKVEGSVYSDETKLAVGDTVIGTIGFTQSGEKNAIKDVMRDPNNKIKTAEEITAILGGENPFKCKGIEGEPRMEKIDFTKSKKKDDTSIDNIPHTI